MSAYKSYTPRRPAEPTQLSSNDKSKFKVEKLQELFPGWSHEDLQSVLTETAGDVELAVARISEGHAEQWGSVTRKKDKKTSQPSQSTSSFSPRGDRDRPSSEVRGGRGGRGRGRGGRGASRAAHSSSHRETRASSAPNGTSAPITEATQVSNDWVADTTAGATTDATDAETKTNGVDAGVSEAWGTNLAKKGLHEPIPEGWTPPIEPPVASSSTTGWVPESASAPAWAPDAGASDQLPTNGSTDLTKAKAQVKTSKIPPGAKLSWAQIARAQDKPKPVAPPPPPTQSVAPSIHPIPAEPMPPPTSEEVTPLQEEQGWEEPTTVQPPTWDDEPSSIPPQVPDLQPSAQDGWITADTVPKPPPQEAWDTPTTFSPPHQDTITQDPNWNKAPPEEPKSAPSPPVTASSVTSLAPTTSTPSATTSTAPTSKPSTPSVTHASARPTNAHRTSARYPKSDQAVVIPAFAGSIGTGGEKLGMQFGSLSIGGEDNFDGNFKTEADTPVASAPEPQQQPPVQPQQAQASTQTQAQDSVPSPVVPVSTHSHNFFQQSTQTTAPAAPAQHISPPQASQQQSQPTSSGPPFGTHQPPPALTHQQQQQQLAQQHHQQQPQHTYGQQQQQQQQQQQHGLHTHFDGPPAPQQQPQQPQHASGPQTGSYFRQPESPYYHNPTPPQSAPPEHQGAYATSFSPLGVAAGAHAHAQGLGGQTQGSHLGGFGGGPGEYGYGDGQRGFYDYAQPGNFSNRLVHDDSSKGGLPISQGSQSTSSLGSAAVQPQTPAGPQGSSSQPPAGQQGQQQGYPAPMPYYYPPYYPQNSYPTYPNPSYGQAYMPKYPVYPHQAQVGPGSAPPPTGKGPSATTPYSASASQSHIYHGQGGFEDPSAGYPHHQGSTNIGSADYQKQPPHHQQQQQQQQQPLYSAQAAQGLQSFLGIQQTPGSGQGVTGPGGQQRSGTSPEAAYKPYGASGGASDKGGVGLGTQQGQQGRTTGVQQAQQQAGGAGSFYPGGRFGAGAGGPQQQGQQQGQGYPQSGDQGQFYPYHQPRHQGGYWQ